MLRVLWSFSDFGSYWWDSYYRSRTRLHRIHDWSRLCWFIVSSAFGQVLVGGRIWGSQWPLSSSHLSSYALINGVPLWVFYFFYYPYGVVPLCLFESSDGSTEMMQSVFVDVTVWLVGLHSSGSVTAPRLVKHLITVLCWPLSVWLLHSSSVFDVLRQPVCVTLVMFLGVVLPP